MAKRGGRAAKDVQHAVAAEERNVIWKACNGIFRPVKSDSFKAAEKDAARQGKHLDDPREGLPTHKTDQPRVTNKQQEEIAEELGYRPYNGETAGAQGPVFYKPGGDPPYISYDRTGHGANRSSEPGRIPWKGADGPKKFGGDDRSGTYNPVYGRDGKPVFQKGRR